MAVGIGLGRDHLFSATGATEGVGPERAIATKAADPTHEDVLDTLKQATVIYLGETHTDMADHVAQLEIITEMHQTRGDIAIGLEMFQRPFQPVLDQYIAGEITEAELIAQSEYETRWGYDWELYAPIFRYAQAEQIPLIALNTPTEITRKVARQGLASLSGDDLEIDLNMFATPCSNGSMVGN